MNETIGNSFDIFSVRNMTIQPNNLKSQSFIYVADEIKKLIKNRASQGFFEINYKIPNFILGFPPFNLLDCASFLYYEFTKNMFEVFINQLNDGNVLIKISWLRPPPEHFKPDLCSSNAQKAAQRATDVARNEKERSSNSIQSIVNNKSSNSIKRILPPQAFHCTNKDESINTPNQSLDDTTQKTRKKKRNTTYKVKDNNEIDIPSKMNFLHGSGYVDEIPVNKKCSVYL
jgi:hypothetical protein